MGDLFGNSIVISTELVQVTYDNFMYSVMRLRYQWSNKGFPLKILRE